MRRLAVLLALSTAVAILAFLLAHRPAGPVLYRGGPVITLDADGRIAEALLTEGRWASLAEVIEGMTPARASHRTERT